MEHSVRKHADSDIMAKPTKRRAQFVGFHTSEKDSALIPQLEPLFQEILGIKGSYVEISLALNIPIGTVRSRLHRARAALTSLREQASTAHKMN